MQIRASTALRNEYLQISQLAKVSGEPIYIRTRAKPIWSFRVLKPMSSGKKCWHTGQAFWKRNWIA